MESTPKWHRLLILLGVGLAGMIVNIDFTIVNTALSTIQKELQASIGELQWVMGAFGISFATLLTITGRIGDVFGRRGVLYVAMGGFLLASVGAALATHPLALIIFRFFQGLFGAGVFPCGMAIVSEIFPKNQKGRAMGFYTALLGIGLAFGPVFGGLIVSFLSWRWIFYINIPIICLSFLLCLPFLHESKAKGKEKIDWFGVTFFILGFGLLVFAITEGPNFGWRSSLVIGSFILSFLLLLFFFYIESKTEDPIIPLKLFHNDNFLLGAGVYLVAVSPIWALFFLFPLYLQNVLGATPGQSGLILLAMTAMTIISPPFSGHLLDKRGAKSVVITLFAFLFFSYLFFLFFTSTGPLWLILLGFILYGIGWGMGNSVGVTLALRNLPSNANAGIVSGAVITILNVVGVFLLSVSGSLFRHFEKKSLTQALQQDGLSIDSASEHLVRTFLSDPTQAANALPGASPDFVSALLSHFRESFVSSFHIVIALLFLFVVLIFLSILKPLFKEKT